MKKIIALMLILAMLFSFSACKSRDDEDDAMADSLVTEQEDNTPTDEPSDDQPTDEPSDEQPTDEPSDDQPTDEPTDEPSDDNAPPPQQTGDKYTVTYDFGYGDKKETVKTDGSLEEYTISRPGHTFEGWYNGKEKWDFSNEVTQDITLTAKWTAISYTITYVADGAEIPSSNPTKYTTSDEEITLKPATKKGKVFANWSITNETGTVEALNIPANTVGNLTLKPIWDETAVVFGKYERDGDDTNGKESLAWIKIKEENGKTLLVTKEIIDCKQYDDVGGNNITWKTCDLRTWLNGAFMSTAFTPDEKKAIATVKLTTPGDKDGSVTDDQVFLFSLEEVKEYLNSYAARRAPLTPYAIAQGAQNSPEGGWWWLRTKISEYGAALIENDGNIRSIGYNGNLKTIGVRPAIWVDSNYLK